MCIWIPLIALSRYIIILYYICVKQVKFVKCLLLNVVT